MAFQNNLETLTLEAGQDLSTKQYFFVTMASDGQVDPTGDGLLANGVLQNKPDAANKAATVGYGGVSKVSAGAAITRGAVVCSDGNGEAVTIASGKYPLGIALEAATSAHDLIAVQIVLTATPRA